jgi:hypothetical protein
MPPLAQSCDHVHAHFAQSNKTDIHGISSCEPALLPLQSSMNKH